MTAALRRRAMLRTLQPDSARRGRPILWLVRPYFADVIGQYGEKLVVYQITDEYSAYASVTDRGGGQASRGGVLRRADLVIVTSPALLAEQAAFQPVHLSGAERGGLRGLSEGAGGSRKLQAGSWRLEIAGAGWQRTLRPTPYGSPHRLSGALNEKIDFGLLAHVARARPDWQLVLIGQLDLYSQPAKADVLSDLPNVQWVGRLPVTALPSAIAGLDVCLLPYERNEWTANIDSLEALRVPGLWPSRGQHRCADGARLR